MSEDRVSRNAAEGRYELQVGDEAAVATYSEQGDVLTFTHTGVPEALESHGVASKLIAGALDDVRRRKLKIIAECEFVGAHVQRHPEARDLRT